MTYSDSDAASSVGSIVEDASEPDTTTFKCLFCDQQWSRVQDMSSHCNSEHKFDLPATIKNLGPGSSNILHHTYLGRTTNPLLQVLMSSPSSSW
jgi:protein arginine N-methyltransferase 3